MKMNFGDVTNLDNGKTEDILVKCHPLSLKDVLAGVGLIAGGVGLLVAKAFKNGAQEYVDAEMDAFERAGLIKDKTNPDQMVGESKIREK